MLPDLLADLLPDLLPDPSAFDRDELKRSAIKAAFIFGDKNIRYS